GACRPEPHLQAEGDRLRGPRVDGVERRHGADVHRCAHLHADAQGGRPHRLHDARGVLRGDAAAHQGVAARLPPLVRGLRRRPQTRSREERVMGAQGKGTKASPWALRTPPGTAEYEAYRDEEADPPALVVQVGKTQLRYHLRAVDDLHAMLVKHGDW